MSETALWRAVILQALFDCHNPTNTTINERKIVQDEANAFLDGGRDLMEICELAGLSYSKTVERIAYLRSNPEYTQRIRRNCYLKGPTE